MKISGKYVVVATQFHHIRMEVFKKALAFESGECKELQARFGPPQYKHVFFSMEFRRDLIT